MADKSRAAVTQSMPAWTGIVQAGRFDRRGVDGGARADRNYQARGGKSSVVRSRTAAVPKWTRELSNSR